MNKDMELLKWLEAVSDNIKQIESAAMKALEQGDAEEYKRGMNAKAVFLAELENAAAPHLEGVSEKSSALVRSSLSRFSAGAATALELNSIFYMSALLYPDEHRPGDPNNFELFVNEVAAGINK
ncbi:MAG: hypothetical protein IJD04_02910 [Desulfovibrionaceae bacterium]|nr:hypothetical protein [Desulfovibrionaceae bacterium]